MEEQDEIQDFRSDMSCGQDEAAGTEKNYGSIGGNTAKRWRGVPSVLLLEILNAWELWWNGQKHWGIYAV